MLDAVLATFMLPAFNPASFRRCPAVPADALG
jgi:carbamoyl-phosphate synthase large subunit